MMKRRRDDGAGATACDGVVARVERGNADTGNCQDDGADDGADAIADNGDGDGEWP
jgi:hypothetical protein